jgi:hypothetical protein
MVSLRKAFSASLSLWLVLGAQAAVIPLDRLPTANALPWNPGIPGGIPNVTTKCVTTACAALENPANHFGDGVTPAQQAINAAIASAPDNTYVHLPAGNYRTTDRVQIMRSNVVLRGDGPENTVILPNRDNNAFTPGLYVGSGVGDWPDLIPITGGSTKGSTTITIAASTSRHLAVGRLITVTIEDTNNPMLLGVVDNQFKWFNPATGAARSIGQTVEILARNGNTLTISSPLYMDFPPEFSPAVLTTGGTWTNVGVEDLKVDGGASTFSAVYANKCWFKNIESANSFGRYIGVFNSNKCVIRDSYFHDARDYHQGGGAYGITLDTYTSDTLIENNVVIRAMFGILIETTGGGNVIGYNYADDTVEAEDDSWQMPGIGAHLLEPHMDLIEGNWASQICLDNVHGGNAYITLFRNYSPGQNSHWVRTSSNYAASILANSYYTNVLGNVWWRPGVTGVYDNIGARGPYLLGYYADQHGPYQTTNGDHRIHDPKVNQTILRNGNFDYVTNTVRWGEDDANDPQFPGLDRVLPDSLYLSAKPSWWGNRPWPYIQPEATTKVNSLPAKDRYDGILPPDPSDTLPPARPRNLNRR